MNDYADKTWLTRAHNAYPCDGRGLPEWADLSPTAQSPRRRTTDRPAEFGPAALTASDRAVLWLSFCVSGATVGTMLFFMLTGGQS